MANELLERAKNRIRIGDPYLIDGEIIRLKGEVVKKYKHYFRVKVPKIGPKIWERLITSPVVVIL